MKKMRYALPNRVFTTKFLFQLMSNYLSRCIWPVNKLPRVYRFRKQHCSSLRRSFFAERKTREMRHVLRLARTTNFSTSRFENSSRGRTHLRISITCSKNRTAAYPFLFPRSISIAYYEDIFLPHVSPIN